MMPPINMQVITIMEPTERSDMPEIPFPLVQPSAMRAPKSIIKPPQNAMIILVDNFDIDATFVQTGEKFFLLVCASVEEI